MIIVGIDPGTARMGYSIVDVDIVPESKPSKTKKKNSIKNAFPFAKMIVTDVLTTPADMDMHMRLRVIYKGLTEVMQKYSPEVMVIEKLFFSTNVKTAITVGQARGIAMLAAADKNMQVFEYTALEAKRLLTGFGRASKPEMQEAVRLAMNLKEIIKSDDANDALAMTLCHLKKVYAIKEEK